MQREIYGTRDLSYSAWHRAASIRRYVGWERAQLLTMCDDDSVLWLEYSPGEKAPLCLIEAAADVGQDYKPATAIKLLARRARIPAYIVLYARAADRNPADPRCFDLTGFRVKRLYPRADLAWRHVAPGEWAQALLQIRSWAARRLDVQAANDPAY